ncbi:MAG: alpha/beta hydrolase [Legionella sp.]|uniref:alpha/beta hydrolase n=1 Tax=Legionella sp. TaxID=459 RepID=UPI00283D39FE|nr:alpha/beta hydrolase [Legionella sp.]
MNVYSKDILSHPEFYIARFTQNPELPYVFFIHGGPGLNCGVIEYFIEYHHLFNSLRYNIIFYDQRNCGRSHKSTGQVLHQDNLDDLHQIILYLAEHYNISICALIGHSYGAKLLCDYYKSEAPSIPGIFISTAKSILTPRLNNLMFDLAYLKKHNVDLYNKVFHDLDNFNMSKLWDISEQLAPLFQENKDRAYLYWANLECYRQFQSAQKKVNLPLNTETFISVREDLYSNESNFSVDIVELEVPTLWINGFHDLVINGNGVTMSTEQNITTFYKSSHYPHLEENARFTALLNEFIN